MKSIKSPQNIHSILKKKTQKKTLQYYGHSNEILFGLLYLVKQYPKKICVPIPNSKITKMEPEIAIKWLCKKKQYKIEFPVNKTEFIRMIKSCKKQLIAIPLYIFFKCNSHKGHANCLIFDNNNHTIERFEPYGKALNKIFEYKDIRILQHFDKAFAEFVKSSKLPYTYKPPTQFCPNINVQQKEENNIEKGKTQALNTDLPGFCSLWIIWYINLKVKYNKLDSSRLLYKSIELLKKDTKSIRSFIRKYALFLQTKIQQYSKKYKIYNLDAINRQLLRELL
jgi:hypothetical protein